MNPDLDPYCLQLQTSKVHKQKREQTTIASNSWKGFYAPNFGKVEGAYCFGLVRISKTITAGSFRLGQLIEDNE